MPIGILYWLLVIFWAIAAFFGSSYPYVGNGFQVVLFGLVGWQIFGPPLRAGSG